MQTVLEWRELAQKVLVEKVLAQMAVVLKESVQMAWEHLACKKVGVDSVGADGVSADGVTFVEQLTNPLPVDNFFIQFIKNFPLNELHGDELVLQPGSWSFVCEK